MDVGGLAYLSQVAGFLSSVHSFNGNILKRISSSLRRNDSRLKRSDAIQRKIRNFRCSFAKSICFSSIFGGRWRGLRNLRAVAPAVAWVGRLEVLVALLSRRLQARGALVSGRVHAGFRQRVLGQRWLLSYFLWASVHLHLAEHAVDELASVFYGLVHEVIVGRLVRGVLLHAVVHVRLLIVRLNFLTL